MGQQPGTPLMGVSRISVTSRKTPGVSRSCRGLPSLALALPSAGLVLTEPLPPRRVLGSVLHGAALDPTVHPGVGGCWGGAPRPSLEEPLPVTSALIGTCWEGAGKGGLVLSGRDETLRPRGEPQGFGKWHQCCRCWGIPDTSWLPSPAWWEPHSWLADGSLPLRWDCVFGRQPRKPSPGQASGWWPLTVSPGSSVPFRGNNLQVCVVCPDCLHLQSRRLWGKNLG